MNPTRRTILGAALGSAVAIFVPRSPFAQEADGTPRWSSGPDLPLPLQEIDAAVHGGDIWIAGGLTLDPATEAIGLSARSLWLGPEAGAWRDGPHLPAPTHHPQLIGSGQNLYAVGGFRAANGGSWSMTTEAYLLDGEEWRGIASLPAPLAESHAAVLDGRVHLAGGRTPAGEANAQWGDHADTGTHYVHEPDQDMWTIAPAMPTARNSGAAVTFENRLYVLGGRTVTRGNLAVVEMFDPVTGAWESLSPMPEPRGGIAAAELDGVIYVFGGEDATASGAGGVYPSVMAYDIAADSWELLGAMPMPRHGLAAVVRNGEIMVIGGATEVGARGTSAVTSLFS